MTNRLLAVYQGDTKTFSVTGLPAILIFVAILAILIGIGILIGRKMKNRKK